MIFVVAGTQLPFPRLMNDVAAVAADRHRRVLAQTADPSFHHAAMDTVPFLSGSEFADAFKSARIIVAHAGMGVILSAIRFGKPLVIMPRRASLGEHRNDHQLATAARFAESEGIYVAHDAAAIAAILDRPDLVAAKAGDPDRKAALIAAIRGAISA